MANADPRTCPTGVNRIKREEPSKLPFYLICISFDTWLSSAAKSAPDLRGTARWRTIEILITSEASVAKFTSLIRKQFVCPHSLDCSFLSSPFYFVTMTTISKWVAHISRSLSSFIFYFPCSDFHLSVFSTHSLLFLARSQWLSVFHSSGSPSFFFSFSPRNMWYRFMFTSFLTTVFNKRFMLHSKHLHHIVSDVYGGVFWLFSALLLPDIVSVWNCN